MLVVCVVTPQLGITSECLRHWHLTGRPLVLARDGSVVVASPEAARAAIGPGESVTGAMNRCADLAVLPYDEPFYQEAARVIWDALAVESSIVDPVTPERCFMAAGGPDLLSRLKQLTEAISDATQTRVQAGLGRTKLIARHAALHAEPRTVFAVWPEEERSFVASLSLSQIEQLDAASLKRLHTLGVHSLGDLRRIPEASLAAQFGKLALLLARLAEGDDGELVRALWPPPSVAETFRFDALGEPGLEGFALGEAAAELFDRRFLDHALRCCCERITARLERERTRCRAVRLAILSLRGDTVSMEEEMERAVSDRKLLFACALRLLARLDPAGPPAELTVTGLRLTAGSGVQLSLLDERGRDSESERRLKQTTAALRRAYGLGCVAEGIKATPRQSMLFTHPFAHHRDEPVDVVLDAQERPVQVARVGSRGGVWDMGVSVRDCWIETRWLTGEPRECTVFRVEGERGAFYDVVHVGYDDWRIMAVAD